MRERCWSVLSALVLSAGLAVAAPPDGVGREGEGERRVRLDAAERKPLAPEVLSALTGWVDRAPTSADLSGRVVVVVTWSEWHPTGARTLAQARRVAEGLGEDGLVILAAHPEGFEEAKAAFAAAPALKAGTVLLAHDPQGAARAALQSDQDPDFYVIDRAGQLRFADIVSESVDAAVGIVKAETTEQAGAINERLAREAADRTREAERTAALQGGTSLKEIPEVAFTPPSADAYRSAAWPRRPANPQGGGDGLDDAKLPLPAAGFLPSPPELKGRAKVIYFWSPRQRETYEGVMDRMDQIQLAGGRDVAVVGVIEQFGSDPSNQEVQVRPDDIRRFIQGRNLKHSVLISPGGIRPNAGGGENRGPFVVVTSSDDTVRFAGSPNDPGFRGALDTVLRVDPGIKARRAAEEAFLRGR